MLENVIAVISIPPSLLGKRSTQGKRGRWRINDHNRTLKDSRLFSSSAAFLAQPADVGDAGQGGVCHSAGCRWVLC